MKTVCVDFDGVLMSMDYFTSFDEAVGPPIPGAIEGLQKLAQRYSVVIHTSRASMFKGETKADIGKKAVLRWLRKWGADHYVSEVTGDKVIASAYIDDRAVEFKYWGDPTLFEKVDRLS